MKRREKEMLFLARFRSHAPKTPLSSPHLFWMVAIYLSFFVYSVATFWWVWTSWQQRRQRRQKTLHRLCFFFPSFFLSVASFISRIFHLFFSVRFSKILFWEKSAFTIFLLSVGCQYFPRQETWLQNRRWKEIFGSVSDPVAFIKSNSWRQHPFSPDNFSGFPWTSNYSFHSKTGPFISKRKNFPPSEKSSPSS